MSDVNESTPASNVPSVASRVRPWLSRWWPALLALALVVVQWPVLKGIVLNAAGVEAEASAIAWRTDFGAALTESRESGKPLLVDFTASWCPPCQVMKRDVWPDDEVERLVNASFIPVLMDVDERAVAPIATRYQITTIPTILVLDADGEILKGAGYLSRRDMVEFLRKAAGTTEG